MNEVLSIQEVYKRFPNEWVVLDQPKTTEAQEILEGRVVAHSPDREEVHECLKKQGGLDSCSLAFYAQGDIGDDGVWDNWRLEGPSFVWYFRGSPHVHLWINIGDSPDVETNAQG